MASLRSTLSALILLLVLTKAYELPSNVQAFRSRIKDGQCTGGNVLKKGFYSEGGGPKTFAYCKDDETGVLYLHGTGSKFANMDIDCDGDQSDHGDGRCGSSEDTQSQTAFKDLVQKYSKQNGPKVSDLNANFIPYVVFGNYGSKEGYTNFHPENFGLKPLSVMAVVCDDQLVYGVWGDTNGDDGKPLIGETSLSLATKCFGKSMNGNNGHSPNDVLYIGFPGTVDETVEKKADWGAKTFADFEETIREVGDKLVKKL